ncbi:peptidylprolyl isomerase [Paenibacillus sp. YPG26]|uniref:peptidylprolyl isomerase n=1 Tax=Paenibacillus sp. YPG26 TaxID=2878915 RepID=UPI00203FE817|nr:peptidylprolyl isomerase [Paenibacillus sp. YPG26]USB33308.1 peptidylprolyl isomerase [Paenibacillus sp. YPG26]
MMLRNNSRSWKTLLVALIAVLTFSILAGCGKKSETTPADNTKNTAAETKKDTSKVVATYEGGEITANEFDLEQRIMLLLQPEMEQLAQMDEFRDYLIKQEIAYAYLSSKADDKSKDEGKKKADEQVNQMKKQLGDEQFKKMLDSKKVTEADLKNYMVKVFTVIESETSKVTEDEIKKEFETKKGDFSVVTVRHILIGLTDASGKERKQAAALKLAKEVKAKLDKGADFAEQAKKYSEDPGSKDQGGLYKDATAGEWVPQFKEKALTLPLNKISDPVETDYGYHIMRVEARTEKTLNDLTPEQKDSLKTNVASAKLDDFMQNGLTKIIKKIELPKVETKKEDAADSSKSGSATTPSGTTDKGTSTNEATTPGTDTGK